MTPEDDEVEADDMPKLGPCCICETTEAVYNIVMLPYRAPIAGRGWGCFVCGLPQDGAHAVVCDGCVEDFFIDKTKLRFACRGYPAEDGRIPIEELPRELFEHDAAKHAADELRNRHADDLAGFHAAGCGANKGGECTCF